MSGNKLTDEELRNIGKDKKSEEFYQATSKHSLKDVQAVQHAKGEAEQIKGEAPSLFSKLASDANGLALGARVLFNDLTGDEAEAKEMRQRKKRADEKSERIWREYDITKHGLSDAITAAEIGLTAAAVVSGVGIAGGLIIAGKQMAKAGVKNALKDGVFSQSAKEMVKSKMTDGQAKETILEGLEQATKKVANSKEAVQNAKTVGEKTKAIAENQLSKVQAESKGIVQLIKGDSDKLLNASNVKKLSGVAVGTTYLKGNYDSKDYDRILDKEEHINESVKKTGKNASIQDIMDENNRRKYGQNHVSHHKQVKAIDEHYGIESAKKYQNQKPELVEIKEGINNTINQAKKSDNKINQTQMLDKSLDKKQMNINQEKQKIMKNDEHTGSVDSLLDKVNADYNGKKKVVNKTQENKNNQNKTDGLESKQTKPQASIDKVKVKAISVFDDDDNKPKKTTNNKKKQVHDDFSMESFSNLTADVMNKQKQIELERYRQTQMKRQQVINKEKLKTSHNEEEQEQLQNQVSLKQKI